MHHQGPSVFHPWTRPGWKTLVRGLLAVFTALSAAGGLGAVEPSLEIHGSLAQSYLSSTHNDILFPGTEHGSFEFSEAYLNASRSIGEKLRVGAQILSRDYGPEGNHDVQLDWGYGDYFFNEKLGMRVGKIRLPLGFYNEYRDVDSARTELLLPQEVYREGLRSFILAYTGVGIYGKLGKGLRAGDVDYHLYVGTLNIPDDVQFVQPLRRSHNAPAMGLETDRVYGGSLFWNTGLKGLRLGFSAARFRGHYDIDSPALFYSPLHAPFLSERGLLQEAEPKVVGVEYQRGRWTLASEYQIFQRKAEYSADFKRAYAQPIIAAAERSARAGGADAATAATAGQAAGDKALAGLNVGSFAFDSQGWYASLSCQFDDRWSAFLRYGEYLAERSQRSTPSLRRDDYAMGLRRDFGVHWRAKAELHLFDGSAGALAVRGNPIADSWSLLALRVSFDF